MLRPVMIGLMLIIIIGAWLAPIATESATAQGYSYYAVVEQAARTHGTSAEWLWAVVGCETGYTYALNLWGKHGEYGPFQFMEGTFYEFAGMSGLGGSWMDPYAQAQVAAWAFANGYGPQHWSCA